MNISNESFLYDFAHKSCKKQLFLHIFKRNSISCKELAATKYNPGTKKYTECMEIDTSGIFFHVFLTSYPQG